MANPITSQTTSRSCVIGDKPIISAVENKIARIGTSGTIGVLNGRFSSGCVLRITQTPALTSTKASRVPTLVISSSTLSGTSVASTATNNPTTMELMYGVRKRGWILLAHGHNRPSRDIE